MVAVLWFLAGIVLIAAEVLSGDFVLLMLGVAALAAAGSGALGTPLWLDVVVFAVISVALITVARPVLKRRLEAAQVRTNADALVGSLAVVVSTVNAHGGKVKLRGESWSARAYDETQVLEPGLEVRVLEISGATAIVWGEP
ncbi:MAG: NfeD family protein [Pseudonocardiaceae bacterium]